MKKREPFNRHIATVSTVSSTFQQTTEAEFPQPAFKKVCRSRPYSLSEYTDIHPAISRQASRFSPMETAVSHRGFRTLSPRWRCRLALGWCCESAGSSNCGEHWRTCSASTGRPPQARRLMGVWWMYCHFAGVSENPTVAGDWRLPRGRNHQISPATQAEPAFHQNCTACSARPNRQRPYAG